MPAYAYETIDAAGRRRRGKAEAASPGALLTSLESRGLVVLDVLDAGPARGGALSFGSRRGVRETTGALAALLTAGMPLPRALGTAAGIVSGEVGAAIRSVCARVERGETLAAVLSENPRFFSPLYVGVIRAGEKSGDLAGAFRRLAAQLEREAKLRERMISTSIYPLLLAIVGGLAVLLLLLFVLPRFVDLLQGAGVALPRSTAMLLSFSAGVQRSWPVLLVVPAAAVLLAPWLRGSDAGRRVWAGLLLRTPLVSTLRRHALAARFARQLGVLLGGGAPLYVALGDAIASMDDPFARDEGSRIRDRVREGASLTAAIGAGSFFPPLLTQLVAVGEESSQLQEFLLKAADIFEDRTEQTLHRLVTIAEPAMIVTFGVVVAFIALSLLQAIYSVNAGAFR
jgi:general secretion pathway protein F